MPSIPMNLKVLLPLHIFIEDSDVMRIVAETQRGSFGLLPRRLDCVMTLAPGLLIYETAIKGEVYLAVDSGVLVKTGTNVIVSVRRAIQGTELDQLKRTVEMEYLTLNEREQSARAVSAKLEAGFLQRFQRFKNE